MNYGLKSVIHSARTCGRGQRRWGLRFYSSAGCPVNHSSTDSKIGSDAATVSWENARPYNEMPGPKALPIIGNLHRFLPVIGEYYNKETNDFGKVIHALNERFGNVVRMGGVFGRPDAVFVYDPDEAEKVYRRTEPWPIRGDIDTLLKYRSKVRKDFYDGTYGLLTSQGEEWWRFRSVVNKVLMRPQIVGRYTDGINKVADDFVERILVIRDENNEMPKDFANELNKWSLESIGFIALDRRFGCLDKDLSPDSEAQLLIRSVLDWFELWYQLETGLPLYRWIETKRWKKFVTALNYFNDVTKKYVDEAVEKIEKSPKADDDDDKSVLERLIAIDKKIAFVMVMDMIQAGIDTTSEAFAACLYLLAKNPEKQEILRKELQEKTSGGQITTQNRDKLTYLKACMKEVMRMNPITYANQRLLTKDIAIAGYQVPKKTPIILCHMAMSTNPNIYSKPDEFLPERWIRSSPLYEDAHKFAWMPFGHGSRVCIGRRFAELEIETLITKILTKFEVSWHHKDMKYATKIIRTAHDPLRFRLTDL